VNHLVIHHLHAGPWGPSRSGATAGGPGIVSVDRLCAGLSGGCCVVSLICA
jgi:hypothetical protein